MIGSKAISRHAIFKLLPVRVTGGVISQSFEVPAGSYHDVLNAQTFPPTANELIQALLVNESDNPTKPPSRPVFAVNPSTLSSVNPLLASDPPSKSSEYNVCALAWLECNAKAAHRTIKGRGIVS